MDVRQEGEQAEEIGDEVVQSACRGAAYNATPRARGPANRCWNPPISAIAAAKTGTFHPRTGPTNPGYSAKPTAPAIVAAMPRYSSSK